MSENNSNKVFDLSVEEVIRLETLMDVVASERNSIEGIRQAIIRAQERLKGLPVNCMESLVRGIMYCRSVITNHR